MKHVIVSTLDLKAHYYGRPFTARSEGEAIRIFTDAINDQQTALHAHPEDYVLYLIGNFEDDTGELQPEKPRILIAGNQIEKR